MPTLHAVTYLFAYIDPTGGLPPSMWGWIVAAVLTALGAIGGVWRLLRLRLTDAWRRRRTVVLLAVMLCAASTVAYGWYRLRSDEASGEAVHSLAIPFRIEETDAPRVLMLALDGLDPVLLSQYIDEGRLPNFAQLAREGVYHPLATTTPPQSPVAWCTLITGSGPETHGVFDFVKRDPATYRADLSLADRQGLALPWRGTPLWERTTIARLGFVAQRLPMVFPPPKLHGRLLAGMGVWDVRGTEGTYFFYSTRPHVDRHARGMLLELRREGDLLKSELPGPYQVGQADDVREPFELELRGDTASLRVQEHEYSLREGQWSNWVTVRFAFGPLKLQKVDALTRVLWRRDGDETTLYVSSLNFDPRAPLYPISHPRDYGAELASAIGPYATRGMPFDTQALSDGVLSDEDFLAQVHSLTTESERMLQLELRRFKAGVLMAYFEGTDIVQHMFYRGIDHEHPLHQAPDTRTHRDAIPAMYAEYDAILGRARAKLGAGGQIVVLSDHGFAPFRQAVHLNAILRDLGYLELKEGRESSDEMLRDVDWSRTRAYAIGLNAVYLNLVGREGQGIVDPEPAAALKQEIQQRLTDWRPNAQAPQPIASVAIANELYGGATHADMPDLVVGYDRGYRASWQTVLGAVPQATLEVNDKKWSGDHCIDAALVPGVFLSSNKRLDAARLVDVADAIERYLSEKVAKSTITASP